MVFFAGFVFVFVVVFIFVGAYLCAKSSTTLNLLELLAFSVASAFFLGAISTLDGEIEAARMSKNKRARARKRENKRGEIN